MKNAEAVLGNMLSFPDAIFVVKHKENKVLRVSEHFSRITGICQETARGMPYDGLRIWDNATEREKIVNTIDDTGEIEKMETRLRHTGGGCKPYLISGRTICLNRESFTIFTASDHSGYKKMETALRQSEQMHEKVQRIAHLGHWELDIATNNLSWSKEIFHIFEIDDKTTQPSYDLFLERIHRDDRDNVNQVFQDSVRDKTIYDIEHRLLMADDRVKYVHERGATTYDGSGRPVKSVGTVQDITALKVAEIEKQKAVRCLRQSQKLESIGTMVSGIAHDFNNILSAIMGYTELSLDNANTPPELVDFLNRIFEAGMRAKDLIGQILTFCRRSEETREPCQVNLLIDETVNLIKGSIPPTIRVEKTFDTDACILANASQFHQVLMNLCTNACHSMEEKGGVLSIGVTAVDTMDDSVQINRFINMAPGNYIKLVVSDTGCGMDQETIDRMFEPFFTTKKKKEGTGLGLSVVHGIIKSHEGHVMVYSEVGVGTRISIFFPVISDLIHEPAESPVLPRGSENILLIDDEESIADMMKKILDSLGYQVACFTDSKAALAYFKTDPTRVDVIISDMNMPGMTGDVLARKFLEIREELPIIICSGYLDKQIEQRALKNGVRSVLVKPVLKRDIAFAVRNVL